MKYRVEHEVNFELLMDLMKEAPHKTLEEVAYFLTRSGSSNVGTSLQVDCS